MKKSILLLLIVIVSIVFSCKKEKEINYLILSGKIENPNSDTLNILNRNQELIKTILLKKDNTFRDTIIIPEGYYSLSDGKEQTKVYLKPKFDLGISLNTKEFDESIIYNGIGSKENNYLSKKSLLQESFGKLNYYGYYAKLSEEDFLKLTDSLYNLKNNLLEEHQNDLSPDFKFIESKSLEYEKLDKYSKFENMKRFVTGDRGFKVSDNYPEPFKNIDLSNEKLLISPSYFFFLRSYLGKIANEELKKDINKDYYLMFLKTVDSEIKNTKIKEELAYDVGKWKLNYTKELDSVYNQIKPLVTSEKYLIEITENYEKLKKIEKGSISPTFELNDINGELVSLNSLKGKLVYIDIWATWCLPCIKEIPDLKKIEEYFKGEEIQFVSICQNDKKERWKTMVSEKKLGGIQLFAPDENIGFFKDYSVQGIPRFILIDKEGKIIDANAKRPSNPKLKEEIEEYL